MQFCAFFQILTCMLGTDHAVHTPDRPQPLPLCFFFHIFLIDSPFVFVVNISRVMRLTTAPLFFFFLSCPSQHMPNLLQASSNEIISTLQNHFNRRRGLTVWKKIKIVLYPCCFWRMNC